MSVAGSPALDFAPLSCAIRADRPHGRATLRAVCARFGLRIRRYRVGGEYLVAELAGGAPLTRRRYLAHTHLGTGVILRLAVIPEEGPHA